MKELRTREPISVEAWRAKLDQTEDDAAGRWKLLSRQMFNSRAFADLTKGGIIFVLAMLDKLAFEPNHMRSGGRGVKSTKKLGPEVLKNDGRFIVTNNELHARGIGSASTISDARKLAWELGFYDVLKTGTFMNPGESKVCERWKLYPDGPYQPKGQPRPGMCLYPNKRASIKSATETIVKLFTTETEIKGKTDKKSRSNELRDLEEPRSLQKSKLIYNLHRGGSDSDPLTPSHGKMHPSQIGDPELKVGNTGEVHGGSSHRTAKPIPEKTDIEKIINLFKSHGLALTCTETGGEDTILTFSDGSTVRVGRYITYTDPNGKSLPDCILPETLERTIPTYSIRASVQLTDVVRQVDEVMFRYGYGHGLHSEPEHGEVRVKFGGDVRARVMVGSIMIERPDRKRLRVRKPAKLEKILKAESALV